jgi:AcrR family transcriptional regulator
VTVVESEPVRRLPPGPHGLPPELVARNQRERLIAAMAEVCAEKGYGSTSVADVARRAGVSTASFYRQFKDKRECMLASFEELFERFLGEVERVCAKEADPLARARVGIGTAAALLAGDPPTARLLTIEIAAVGVKGVRLQHEVINRMAARLRVAPERDDAQGPSGPSVEWTATAAMVALVAKRVAEGQSPDAAELEAIWAQF